jgi:hypothetical protein
MLTQRWVGVDFDGTLARHLGHDLCGFDFRTIGAPLEPMIEFVRNLLAAGENVRIFTARYAPHSLDPVRQRGTAHSILALQDFCHEVFGVWLPITNAKDDYCKRIYDDIAVQVEHNTGRRITCA